MRAMVYSSKDFESLWFLYQAEGLPKNISIEEFCTKHGVDYPTFDNGTARRIRGFTLSRSLVVRKKTRRFRLRQRRLVRRVRCMILSDIPSSSPLTGWPTSTRKSPSA
jgi:hypothetical protein